MLIGDVADVCFLQEADDDEYTVDKDQLKRSESGRV